MKRHLIAVGIAVIALAAWVGTASAANDPPPGADQILGQLAGASQGAPAVSTAGQDASNLGLPIGITGMRHPDWTGLELGESGRQQQGVR